MFFLTGLEIEYLSQALTAIFRPVKNILLGIWVMGFHFFLVGMIWVLCLCILTLLGVDLEKRGRWTAWFTHNLMGKPIAFLAGIKVQYRGVENLDYSSPFIVAANHASWIDIVVLLYVQNFLFISKQLVGYFPPLGPMGRLSGQVFVPRDKQGSLALIWNALSRRPTANLLVYIEGTRTKDGKLGKLKTGAAATAIRFNRSIVPTTIIGTYKILGDNFWDFLINFHGGTVTVKFHQTICPTKQDTYQELTARVGQVIHRQL